MLQLTAVPIESPPLADALAPSHLGNHLAGPAPGRCTTEQSDNSMFANLPLYALL